MGLRGMASGLLFHDHDAALAEGIHVLLADHAAQVFGDVVDQHLVVQLHAILEQRGAVGRRERLSEASCGAAFLSDSCISVV